jgi:uncharacterized protein
MLKKYFPILILSLFFINILSAQTTSIPERPSPARLVNNLSKQFPNFISSDEEAQLEQKLEGFARETSNQIVIVIVDDFGGDEAYNYANRLGEKWGVGVAKSDNGIVILIKPTEPHELFIAPGKGLEGAIPDITTKQIREDEMNPHLRNGENFTALDKGTDVLMSLAKGEYDSDAYAKKHSNTKLPIQAIVLLIFFIIYIIIRISSRGGGSGGLSMGSGFFLGSMFGGGFGGGGGSSSSGGGGFGGFGGGSFGGGGSGGSW